MGVKTAFGRPRTTSLGLLLAGFGLLGAGPASAATFHPKPGTQEIVEDVATANANGETNTIVLEGSNFKAYLPVKKLEFTDTKGTQTIEAPAGSPSVVSEPARLSGSSIESEPSETIGVAKGV